MMDSFVCHAHAAVKGILFRQHSLFPFEKESARRMAVLKAVLSAPDEPSVRQRAAPRQMLNLSQWQGLSHIFTRYRGSNAPDGEAFPFLLFFKEKQSLGLSGALAGT